MDPVCAVYVHIRYPFAFISESEPVHQCDGSLVLGQYECLHPVHLVFPEHELTSGSQGFGHISLTGMILIEMIPRGTVHHAAVCQIEERHPSYYHIRILKCYPQGHETAVLERHGIEFEIPLLHAVRKVRIVMCLGEFLMEVPVAPEIVSYPACFTLLKDG